MPFDCCSAVMCFWHIICDWKSFTAFQLWVRSSLHAVYRKAPTGCAGFFRNSRGITSSLRKKVEVVSVFGGGGHLRVLGVWGADIAEVILSPCSPCSFKWVPHLFCCCSPVSADISFLFFSRLQNEPEWLHQHGSWSRMGSCLHAVWVCTSVQQ